MSKRKKKGRVQREPAFKFTSHTNVVVDAYAAEWAATYKRNKRYPGHYPQFAHHIAGTCEACRTPGDYCAWRGDIQRMRERLRRPAERPTILYTLTHTKSGLQRQLRLSAESSLRVRAQRVAGWRRESNELLRQMRRAAREVQLPTEFEWHGRWFPTAAEARRSGIGWKLRMAGVDLGPLGPEAHLGIEIECGVDDRDALVSDLAREGLAMRVTVGDDGSLAFDDENDDADDDDGDGDDHVRRCSCATCRRARGESTGVTSVEVRVCVAESAAEKTIDKVCRVLARREAQVNSTCGLHVHIDCRRRDPDLVFTRLYRALPWLYAVVSDDRRDNSYCRRNASPDMRDQRDRYRALNGEAYDRHKTIEVRLHQGTVSAETIKHWVRLLLAVADGPDIARMPRELYPFARRLGLPAELTAWIDRRARIFSGDVAEGLTLAAAE